MLPKQLRRVQQHAVAAEADDKVDEVAEPRLLVGRVGEGVREVARGLQRVVHRGLHDDVHLLHEQQVLGDALELLKELVAELLDDHDPAHAHSESSALAAC